MNDCQANLRFWLTSLTRPGLLTLTGGLIFIGVAATQTTAQGWGTLVAQTSTPAASTPTSSEQSSRPTLRLGSQGEAVSELQAVLKLLGFYSGSVTGKFEEPTQAAVRRFQEVAGLTSDGIVGSATWSRLFLVPQANSPTATTPPGAPVATNQPSTPAASAPRPTTPASNPSSRPTGSNPSRSTGATNTPGGLPVLRPGMTGDAVVRLQERLRSLGFYKGTVDGVFGAQTEQAVKQAQRHYNIEADGIVGPATWDAILP
ncbi:MAG TPA: peptidoglycan-binding protein [Leptolyngbyaceae cyanobacterium]